VATDKTYIAFLRGINVGGHHKVPMADLKAAFEKLACKKIVTILNSGNVIFETTDEHLEKKISEHLKKRFGFPIPTVVRTAENIDELLNNSPFKDVKITKDIRCYASFLWEERNPNFKLPWTSTDGSFMIVKKRDKTIFSVLDLSISKTPKAMDALEKYYGKEMTTRNWKTIERIGKKLKKG
jgi:uncharacterized protein (DUF1697 family)